MYTSDQLQNGNIQPDPISRAVAYNFFAQRSGDYYVIEEPYYMFSAGGTTHGTPYDYDNHVPVIFFGVGIKPGSYHQKIAVNDIAPTLATILGVEQPAGSIGRVLGEILQ